MDTRFGVVAHGHSLDVDALAIVMGSLVTKTWRRGGFNKSSGLEMAIGDGVGMSWEKQLGMVSDYIMRHETTLATASRFPGVDRFTLKLYWRLIRDRNIVALAMVFPKSIMRTAVGVGLTPITYIHFANEAGGS